MTITSIKIANAMVEQLRADLAAAQATIEQMREALKVAERNNPANLDALHEARAEALERADRIFMQMSLDLRDTTLRFAYGAARDVLKNEAAAHRARKQATKEEGK